MTEQFTYPPITIENKIISDHLNCKDAVLLKVENGANRLRYVRNELIGRINAGYTGIEQAVEQIEPYLRMLDDGYYVLADYELFPYLGKKHFWEMNGWSCSYETKSKTSEDVQIEAEIEIMKTRSGARDIEISRPSYLTASKKAAECNPERVEYYRKRLEEKEQYPRAIGCYFGNDKVMLVDGHHKAAAAAANGEMVKCLVIMPAILYGEIPSIDGENGKAKLLQIDWSLYDDTARKIGRVEHFFSIDGEDEDWHGAKAEMADLSVLSDVSDWGQIPEEYCLNRDDYVPIPRDATDRFKFMIYKIREYGYGDDVQFAGDYYFLKYAEQTRDGLMYMVKLLKWNQEQLRYLKCEYKNNPEKLAKESENLCLRPDQWAKILKIARRYKLDQNPKTAGLFEGVFSFYPGQTRIKEIPELLSHKLDAEKIKTVLIPNTVQEIDKRIFRLFPYLEKVIVEEGSPYFKAADFEKELREIRRERAKKRAERKKEASSGYYPFANLWELMKEQE